MGNNVKSLLLFAAGFGIGAAAGYFYQKAKSKVEVSEQLEIMRHYYESRGDKLKQPEKEKEKDIVEDKSVTQYKSITRNYTSASYDTFCERDVVEEIVENALAEREHPLEGARTPFRIPEEQCGYGYDECEVTLYKDGVLVDDASLEEIDINQSLGPEIFKMLRDTSIDEDIYIRNEKMGIDYIVHREPDTFRNTILE